MNTCSPLNADYIQGYTAALCDVRRAIPGILIDMTRQKVRITQKELDSLLKAMIESRAVLRENPDAFVRRNVNGTYEIFIEGR